MTQSCKIVGLPIMRKKLCNKNRKTWKLDFFRQIEGIPINPLNHVYCFIFKNQSYTRNFYMNVNNAFNALKKSTLIGK